ncbi:hypothetical protein LCGC14_2786570, partial [marine sediment metagenome]
MILSFIGWTWLARQLRGKVLSLRNEDFILAAKMAGDFEQSMATLGIVLDRTGEDMGVVSDFVLQMGADAVVGAVYVVVHGLWDGNHRDALLVHAHRVGQRVVPTDRNEDIQLQVLDHPQDVRGEVEGLVSLRPILQEVGHVLGRHLAGIGARGVKHGATAPIDRANRGLVERPKALLHRHGIVRVGLVLGGRQLTAGELGAPGAFEEAPNPDSLVPCYVNEATGMFAYWDDELIARRMPWQKGEHGNAYYRTETARQTSSQFTRLHLNKWVSAESEFVPMPLWDACKQVPWPLEEGERTPLIIGLDAAVTQDNFGLVVVSRDPDRPVDSLAVRM